MVEVEAVVEEVDVVVEVRVLAVAEVVVQEEEAVVDV